MRGRTALGVLLVVGMGLVVGPALAVSGSCPDDGEAGCCGTESSLCLCCSSGPRTTLPFVNLAPAAEPAGSVGAEALPVPPGPLPHDVLHVPIAPPCH